ncbi:MAG: NAD-dependent epimerase/dehydratase family protein [Candidatus Micrarchaeia archaeon]|jgi:UDP-glucose 4-epimerase
MAKIVVTGSAGFIASHMCEALLAKGHEVVGYDNLSAGKMENMAECLRSPHFSFVRGDILNMEKFGEVCEGAEAVYHLAADPLVKESAERPMLSFEQNVIGTFRVLEAARRRGVKRVVFTSTSTVYGDAVKIPTPEESHLEPISNYGASKLACESYLGAYAHTYGMKCTAVRYANIYGERGGHGVMKDFYVKLIANPAELEILGNGKQDKSYLYVDDAVKATLLAAEKQKEPFNAYNVGSRHKHKVDEIARLISRELGLKPKFMYTGGKRGWIGDVSVMLLSTKKIEKLGWRESIGFEKGVRRYLSWLAKSG